MGKRIGIIIGIIFFKSIDDMQTFNHTFNHTYDGQAHLMPYKLIDVVQQQTGNCLLVSYSGELDIDLLICSSSELAIKIYDKIRGGE